MRPVPKRWIEGAMRIEPPRMRANTEASSVIPWWDAPEHPGSVCALGGERRVGRARLRELRAHGMNLAVDLDEQDPRVEESAAHAEQRGRHEPVETASGTDDEADPG